MNARATRSAIGVSILAVATAACPSKGSVSPTAVVTAATPSRASVPGPTTAAQALAELCEVKGQLRRDPVAPSGSVPAIVSSTEVRVAAARGHPFERAVAVEGVTPDVLDDRLLELFDASYPEDLYSRRSRAWGTMDVIPDDYDLKKGLREGTQRAVVGFYDPTSEALVYQGGSSDPGPDEQFILAHELTHALDDQRFDLLRLSAPHRACLDDEDLAASSLSEGDAQYTAAKVLVDSVGAGSQLHAFVSQLATRPPIPGGNIPILADISYVPYTDGLLFVQSLVDAGGTAAVDDAFAALPVSTEQILHPERYPTDRPREVEIADLGPMLGADWRDLDVMEVGEAFLRAMLTIRMFPSDAVRAAAGWDGGLYRAWSDGDDVAIVMRTLWDDDREAGAFAEAVDGWILGMPASTRVRGDRVDVLYGSDDAVLHALESVAGEA